MVMMIMRMMMNFDDKKMKLRKYKLIMKSVSTDPGLNLKKIQTINIVLISQDN